MAQFRAIIKGQRGAASRLGSKKSGIIAAVNGWNVGVSILGGHEDGEDVFYVIRNGGSNGTLNLKTVAKITRGKVEFYK